MTTFEGSWKSPRQVEQDIKDYQRKRFDDYMEMVDTGAISRSLAIAALRDEMEYNILTEPQNEDK